MNEETFYKIKLDLVHNTINNFVHVMQYDDGVAYIRAEIYKDWQHVYPSEEFDSAELRLKKHNGAWIKCNSVEPYIPVAKPPYAEAKEAGVYYYYSEGSYILVTSSMTEQAYNEIDPNLFYKNVGIIISLEHDYVKISVVSALTDIYGGCAAVIDLYSTDGHIQTAKFVLDVDRNPIQTGETIKNVPEDISIKLAELSGGLASAVKVTPQTLTDEEKAQARENIGVGASDLNIENGTGTNSVQQKGIISDNQLSSYKNPGNNERIQSQANGKNSFAEGSSTLTRDEAAHAEGMLTYAEGSASHAEGGITQALNYASHSEGHRTISREFAAHAEGERTEANGHASHAEGQKTKTTGTASHAEGSGTIASGLVSHAGGAGDETMTVYFFEDDTQNHVECSGNANVVFGQGGEWVQVTGLSTNVTTSTFYGWHTPAEVFQTFAVGDKLVVKYGTKTYVGNIISKGQQTNFIVSPKFETDLVSYVGTFYINRIIKQEEAGKAGESKGDASFIHGDRLVAANDNEAVFGKYNMPKEKLLFEVGNGINDANRSNAFEVYEDGHAEVQTQGATDKSVAQVKFVQDYVAEHGSSVPSFKLSSAQIVVPMDRTVHNTYTEHTITFSITNEQANYIEDNSNPVIKLQLSQHIPYVDGDYLYLQRNVIQTLNNQEAIQFTFNNARFNFDKALTEGKIPMTEIGDGAAIYAKSTKTLFISFVETSPKKVEDSLIAGQDMFLKVYTTTTMNTSTLPAMPVPALTAQQVGQIQTAMSQGKVVTVDATHNGITNQLKVLESDHDGDVGGIRVTYYNNYVDYTLDGNQVTATYTPIGGSGGSGGGLVRHRISFNFEDEYLNSGSIYFEMLIKKESSFGSISELQNFLVNKGYTSEGHGVLGGVYNSIMESLVKSIGAPATVDVGAPLYLYLTNDTVVASVGIFANSVTDFHDFIKDI